VHYYSCVLLI